jgi:hypothetical protein
MRQIATVLLAVATVVGLSAVLVAQDTAKARVAGQLTKIEGKALTITATVEGQAKDTVITCNEATKFSRDGAQGVTVTFADLKVGQSVRAYYTTADNIAMAVMIQQPAAPAQPANVRIAGQLTKIDGKALTIAETVNSQTRETVITCNDATKFSRDGDKGATVTFADLKVGQSIRAYYTAADKIAVAVMIAGPAPGSPAN